MWVFKWFIILVCGAFEFLTKNTCWVFVLFVSSVRIMCLYVIVYT